MTLSICIPTFKRPKYLRYTLNRLLNDFSGADICVSDNDPEKFSETWCLCCDGPVFWPEINYIQQPINIGPFANQLAALQMGRRQYAVYCADDDYLLPDEVSRGTSYLDEHPEVAAYCAPCEIWNEVTGTPYWNAFGCDERTFKKGEGVELFNTIIERHIWPEHLIYRLPLPLKPRTRAYWAFADLPDILEAGAIHFSPRPFYRNLLVHPVGEREQLGNVQCLTYFDEYRAGLEVLACGLFGDSLSYKARHQIQEMIGSFICTRMDVASRLYERAGYESDAKMLRKRLAIADPRRDVA
jgi:glycosyl transferase family 2